MQRGARLYLGLRGPLAYFFTASLPLLLIVLAGEEIGWGQRIFGITVPETIAERSVQAELNFHNLWFIESKTQISLVVFSLVIGVALPLAAMTPSDRRLMQRYCCPAPTLPYAILFIGAVVVGFYYDRAGLPLDPHHRAKEVREFLISTGILFFAVHALTDPAMLFRSGRDGRETEKSYDQDHQNGRGSAPS